METHSEHPGASSPLLIGASATIGGLGVVLGAFGAHAIESMLEETGRIDAWRTAVDYQLLHVVAVLALLSGRSGGAITPNLAKRVCFLWLLGCVLFSGSIYALCLGLPGIVFGPITPIGGILMTIGWGMLAFHAFAAKR